MKPSLKQIFNQNLTHHHKKNQNGKNLVKMKTAKDIKKSSVQFKAKTYDYDNENLIPTDQTNNSYYPYIISKNDFHFANKQFGINNIEFKLNPEMTIGNLSFVSKVQKYVFGWRSQEDFNTLFSTPKVVLSAKAIHVTEKDPGLNRYVMLMTAPELFSNNAPSLINKNLPPIFELMVEYSKTNPNYYRIEFGSLIGGCEDGKFRLFSIKCNKNYNYGRLADQEPLFITKMMRAPENFKSKDLDNVRFTKLGSEYSTLENALTKVLNEINLHHCIISTDTSKKILEICDTLVDSNEKFNPNNSIIKEITSESILNSIKEFETNKEIEFSPHFLDQNILTTDSGKFKYRVTISQDKNK